MGVMYQYKIDHKKEKAKEKEDLPINLINTPKSPLSEIIKKIRAIREKFIYGCYILSIICKKNCR
jgi:hypothetical protein